MSYSKLLFVGLLSLILNSLTAQDSLSTKYLLSKPKSFGFYIAPEVGYGQLNSHFTLGRGVSLMTIFNNKFAIGASVQSYTYKEPNLTTRYYSNSAGLKLEYTLAPQRALHVSFPLLLGITSVGQVQHFFDNSGNRNSDRYITIQPGVALEANLLKFAKMFVSANYRLSFDADNSTNVYSTDYASGLGINVGVKIGLFNVMKNKD